MTSRPPDGQSGQPDQAGASRASRGALIVIGLALAAWLALVVFTASRHEFWRDEVRALSLVREAGSPLDLYRLIQYDGHPVLWYVLLFIGASIVDSPLVLPVTAIVIAFAAVALFMRFAPFPLWFRCLFIFGALPLFEYAVMARNYGITLLVLFAAAMLYPSRRTHPFRLAVTLALLANTNVHSAMLTGLFAAAWVWDIARDQRRRLLPSGLSPYLPLAVVGAGIVLCLVFTMPRENTILTTVRQPKGIGDAGSALRGALLRPDLTFTEIVPSWVRPKIAVLVLYGAIAGLFMRPNLLLAALAAQTVFGVFFRLVYPGWFRHQGLYLAFLVFLYWLLIDSAAPRASSGLRRLVFRGGLYGSVLLLVLFDVSRAPGMVRADIAGTRSASPALATFLNGSPELQDAILVPEPDFAMESLPYYAANPIYLPREGRFATTVSWTSASKPRLTLGEVLQTARAVRSKSNRPVLIVLAPLDLDRGAGEQKYFYGKVFTWSAGEVEEFRNATTLLGEFDATAGDEDFQVFALTR